MKQLPTLQNIPKPPPYKQARVSAGTELGYNSIPFQVDTIQNITYTYNLFVYGHIESAFDFVNVITVLQQATPDDEVNLYLSGQGGCLSGVDAVLHAIESATHRGVDVHCICSGMVASAFTFIPLVCSSFELAMGTHFLLHCGSVGNGGTLSEYRVSSNFHVNYMETRFKEMYEHFLTETEMEDMLKGVDLWLTAEEFSMRYEKRNVIGAALMAQEKAEAKQPAQAAEEQYLPTY